MPAHYHPENLWIYKIRVKVVCKIKCAVVLYIHLVKQDCI